MDERTAITERILSQAPWHGHRKEETEKVIPCSHTQITPLSVGQAVGPGLGKQVNPVNFRLQGTVVIWVNKNTIFPSYQGGPAPINS